MTRSTRGTTQPAGAEGRSSRFKSMFEETVPEPPVQNEVSVDLEPTAPPEKPARRGGRRKREQPHLAKTIRLDEGTDAMLKELVSELESSIGRYLTEQELTVALYRLAHGDTKVRAKLEQRLGRAGAIPK